MYYSSQTCVSFVLIFLFFSSNFSGGAHFSTGGWPPKHKPNEIPTISEDGSCFHVLQSLKTVAIHFENAIVDLCPPILPHSTQCVNRRDIEAPQLIWRTLQQIMY